MLQLLLSKRKSIWKYPERFRIGSATVAPPERHSERMHRNERRDEIDAGKLWNAARLAFRNFFGLLEEFR